MRKLYYIVLIGLTLLPSCKEHNPSKDMNQLSFTTQQAAQLTAIACQEARGDQQSLAIAIDNGLDADLTINQIKEALAHLYAYTGFPRALNAANTLERVLAERSNNAEKQTLLGEDASPLPCHYNALQQGTKVQTMLSGREFNYTFIPAIDYYLKAHLFGDIFARDILTYADRELITVSALSGMEGVEPQLAAHIRGARNMGLTEEQLQGIVVALATQVGAAEAGRLAALLQTEWDKGEPNTAYARYFIGNSYLHPYEGVSNVTFEPGCRNNWHIHHGAVQVLICVSGKGWYQEWGKEAVALIPGTVVFIPEGVKHWHGAAEDSWMQHLAMHTQVQSGSSNEWLEPVTEKQYANVNQ